MSLWFLRYKAQKQQDFAEYHYMFIWFHLLVRLHQRERGCRDAKSLSHKAVVCCACIHQPLFPLESEKDRILHKRSVLGGVLRLSFRCYISLL